MILETNCSPKATRWENATKKAITNRMITDMCSDLFNDDFSYFIEKNKDDILSVLKGNIECRHLSEELSGADEALGVGENSEKCLL